MSENTAWSTGVRVGWLVTPTILSCVDGGFTQANFSGMNINGDVFFNGTPLETVAAHTYDGWFLGSGAEAALPVFGKGWFARVEYRYSEYERASLPAFNVPALGGGISDVITVRPTAETVRTGLSVQIQLGFTSGRGQVIAAEEPHRGPIHHRQSWGYYDEASARDRGADYTRCWPGSGS